MSEPIIISPVGGNDLTPEQAAIALREALLIIHSVGTTGIEHKWKDANKWLRAYFPSYADT